MTSESSRPRSVRRRQLLQRLPLLLLVAPPAARTQPAEPGFPSRPITLIIPFPAGGPTDRQMRLVAELVEPFLGQPVVVVNRPGAGGTLGPATMAATARPDGYTLSQFPGAMLRLPHLQKVAWHPLRDFSFICGLSSNGFGLVVHADSPYRTARDYLDAARAEPGRVDYGSAGVGTSSHLLMAQLARAAGVVLNHVPYKGANDMIQALLGGHLMAVNDASGWEKPVDEGRLRLVLTFGDTPARRWPQVPTARALGYDVVSNSAHGLVGPPGMDPAIVRVLHDAFRRAMRDPRHEAMLQQLNQQSFALDGPAFRQWAAASFEQERVVLQRLGMATGG
jgi:tripartite-type tricarboxylate transporter receptor subunit TctC